jgi:hypothetical protein
MVEHAMSDKAERVAEKVYRIATTRGETISVPIFAAILREEYPEAPEDIRGLLRNIRHGDMKDNIGNHWYFKLSSDEAAAEIERYVQSRISPAPDVSALREVSPGAGALTERILAQLPPGAGKLDWIVPDADNLPQEVLDYYARCAREEYPEAAPDVTALREAYCISVCGEYCTSMQCRSWRKFAALLHSEPKLGGTV